MDPTASTRTSSSTLARGARTLRRTALSTSLAILAVGLGWTCVAAAIDAAAVRNPSNSISSATMLLSATTPVGGTCVSTGSAITTNAASCPGSPYPTGQLSATSSSAASSTLTSAGNTSPSSGSVAQACGVASLADSSSAATDTALPFYGMTFGFAGPMGQTAMGLDGSTGFGETLTSYSNPEGFTLLAWFKTTAPGTIASFTNTQYATATSRNDRSLWVDNAGNLVWSFNTVNPTHEIRSATTVNTGAWVFAAATIGPAGATLYINGALAASTALTTARNYTGWWHLGWGAESNWSDAPSSLYLNGSLAQVAVVPSQLTAAQVLSLTTASASGVVAYDAAVSALTPTAWWQLADSGSSAYTGNVPAIAAPACSHVWATVQTTRGASTACVYPVAAGACPAPSGTSVLSAMPVSSLAAPLAGSPVTFVVTLRLSTTSVTGVAGLQLLPRLTISSSVTGTLWSASLSYPSASVEL